MSKLVRKPKKFKVKVRKVKFSNEVLLKGTVSPPSDLSKVQFQHFIDLLSYALINSKDRKIKFRFSLIVQPDIGEINFNGEFVFKSRQQDQLNLLIDRNLEELKKAINIWILNRSCYNAKRFAKRNNFPFPPVRELLNYLE